MKRAGACNISYLSLAALVASRTIPRMQPAIQRIQLPMHLPLYKVFSSSLDVSLIRTINSVHEDLRAQSSSSCFLPLGPFLTCYPHPTSTTIILITGRDITKQPLETRQTETEGQLLTQPIQHLLAERQHALAAIDFRGITSGCVVIIFIPARTG